MPKLESRLALAEQHDREAETHIRKVIEWEQAAISAASPAERERFTEKARKERDAAMTALHDANIAFGPEIREFRQDSDPSE